jgi:hypothetical protein
MTELIRTNDLVLLSYLEALLKDAGITARVLDGAMSAVDGSIGALPRRLVVDDADATAARRLMEAANVG